MTRLVPLIVFVIFAAMAAVMLLHEKPKATHANRFAMPALEVATLDGESQTLQFTTGISVVNFFASWCTPCLVEHKELVVLKKKFPDIIFHGVAWNDKKESTEGMLREHGNPYDYVWADGNGKSAISLGIRGIPETYIVKNGTVIYHIAGPITESIRIAEIEGVLAQ